MNLKDLGVMFEMVKNFWSLEVGEAIVAEKLKTELKDYEVFFPVKGRALDLVLIKDIDKKKRKAITIEVKSSRDYANKNKDVRGHWITISDKRMNEYKNRADYFIFFIPSQEISEESKPKVRKHFLVIPVNDMFNLLKKNKITPDKNKNYQFGVCHNLKTGEVFDDRLKGVKYTRYLDRWDLIK
jgi:hypothetical protein